MIWKIYCKNGQQRDMIFPPSIVKPEPGPPKYNPTNAMARRLFQMRKTEGMSEYQAVSSPRLRSGCVVRILGSNHTYKLKTLSRMKTCYH